jgi:hypothetical protein
MQNAKNQIQEIYQQNGWEFDADVVFGSHQQTSSGWTSVVDVDLPDGRTLKGQGTAAKKTQADVAAAAMAIAHLEPEPEPEEQLWLDAQCGDALIKLARYLTAPTASREANSNWLQQYESDDALGALFDRWEASGEADVQPFTGNRGNKYRATAVEALVWRRFKKRVFTPQAVEALAELVDVIESPQE